MKKSRAKLTALILAATCSAACVGVGIAVANPETTAITANAEEYTSYNFGLAVHRNSNGTNPDNTPKATQLYMKRSDGQAAPIPDDGNNGWNTKFALVSGDGWKLNGNAVTVGNLLTTNAGLFVDVSAANVQVGDVLTVSGTFTSDAAGLQFVIAESAFVWTGTIWENYVAYTTYNLGDVYFSSAANNNKQIYLKPVSGKVEKADDGNNGWTAKYSWKDGVGITINGSSATISGVKFPGSIFVELTSEPNVGDVMVVGGTFYNSETAVEYVITETSFKWDGAAWVLQDNAVQYDTYTVTKIGGYNSGAAIQVYSLGGDELPKDKGDWDNVYTFETGSGDGIKVNDTVLSNSGIKMPGDLYVPFSGTPVEGDIFTIDGTYYNDVKAVKLIFDNCKMQYDGKKWVAYVEEEPELQYTTYTVTSVGANNDSNADTAFVYSKTGDALPKDQGDWDSVYTLEAGSGAGVKLNDTTLNPEIKLPGDLYVPLGTTAVAGDIFTIDGTYYNDVKAIKLVFDNCKLQFDGEKWTTYADPAEITEHNLGALGVHNHSAGKTSNVPTATQLYMKIASGMNIPYPDGEWNTEFVLQSGAGWKLNGDDVSSFISWIESTNAGLFVNLANIQVNEGDVFSVEGTFFSEDVNAKYIITESKFVWNGTIWEDYVEYTTHEISGLQFQMIGSNGLHAYFLQENGEAFPIYSKENNLNWETEFAWKNGAGIAINGEAVLGAVVKYPGQMFVAFPQLPKAGDVLTIGGTFYSLKLATQYIVTESQFQWDGTTWIPVVEYDEYEVGTLDVANGQTEAKAFYARRADGSSFIASNTFNFLGGSGTGIALNGVTIPVNTIEVNASQVYIDINTTAKDGDVVTIAGTFYNVEEQVKYIIAETSFMYESGAWKLYVSQYEEIGVGQVNVDNEASSERALYLVPVDSTLELPVNDWEVEFTRAFGLGVTLNGETLATAKILSIDNTLYLSLGKSAAVNDIVTIAGKFVCEAEGVLYFVEEASFAWNGEAWKSVINYKTYEVGKLALYGNSASTDNGMAGTLHLTSSTYKFATEEFALVYESGLGFTVNGEQRELSVCKNAKEGYFYVKFDNVQVGDVVKIGGSFVCPEKAIKYVIEESTFTWEGAWIVECEKINVGAVTYHGPQPDQDNAFYVIPVNGMTLPVNDWIPAFVLASGNGITLNGEPIDYTNHVKSVGTTIYIALPRTPQEGDVLVIDGSLRCATYYVEYVFAESCLVFRNGTWVNQLYDLQAEKKAALDEYLTTFTEADYYETEWAAMQEIVFEAKAGIDEATVKAEVLKFFDEAMAAMDAVATKAEVDANFSTWKEDAKVELSSYKDVSVYRAAEQAKIAEIIAQAKTDIDACTSSTALNKIVKDAKAAMDALFTAEEWEVAETLAVQAKEALATYKTQSEYKTAEWNEIQAIIAKAYADIDAAIGNSEAVEAIVEAAKAKMDKVKTATQVEAEQAVIAAAKAELASYKTESNYNAPEWAQIQAIITKANADIEAAAGENEAIAEIVSTAKANMDKVLNSEQANAKAFAAAKAAAETEIRDYVNTIDYSLYTDEAAAQVNAYIAAALETLENATTEADFATLVSDLKAQVESVEKMKKETKKGCSGSVAGLTAGVTLVAAAALVLCKKED